MSKARRQIGDQSTKGAAIGLCGDEVGIGYTYDGTNFIAPIQPIPEPVE